MSVDQLVLTRMGSREVARTRYHIGELAAGQTLRYLSQVGYGVGVPLLAGRPRRRPRRRLHFL